MWLLYVYTIAGLIPLILIIERDTTCEESCSIHACVNKNQRGLLQAGRIKMIGSKKVIGILGVAAAVALASATLAAPAQLKFVNTDAWGQAGAGDIRGGGPFEVTPINQGVVDGLGANGAAAGNYLSFCVELNEHVGNATYNADQNTEAINGGVGGGNPDPLDARTAFLFTAFLKGTLASKLAGAGLGTFTIGDGASGTALQEAIWVIEQEIDVSTVTSTLATDILALADTAVANGGEWFGKGIGNVRILNLTDVNTGDNKQDQLILIPLPLPAVLGLVGLMGIAGISYKRRLALA